MNNLDKIKARIKKLLRMADDAGSPNEAAIAADRAAKLMRQYQIDHSEVVLEDLTHEESLESALANEGFLRMPGWYQSLSISVARAVECEVRIVWHRDGNRSRKFIRFYGYGPDVELAQWLMAYLLTQIERLSAQHRESVKHDAFYIYRPRRYMNNYRHGLGAGIRRKLAEFYAQGNEDVSDTSRALVVAKSNAIKAKFGGFGYTTTKLDAGAGYAAGKRDGANVNVSRAIGSGQRAGPKLLGGG